MKRNKSLILLPVLIIIFFGGQACSDNTGTTLSTSAINVEVTQVTSINENEMISYSGTIEESETIPLSFTTAGSVLRVEVNEGEIVKKGQALAVLDNESAQNAYRMSAAALEQAEDAYKRMKPMYENGNLPEIKLVEVETGLQQAKAAAAIAEKNLKDCVLYSTVDGFVGDRSIEPGMNVIPGLTAVSIVRIEKVLATVSVSENEIALIKKGADAIVKVGALGNNKFDGKVEEIGVVADPLAHTYKIKVGVINKDGLIKPGMICNVTLKDKNSLEGVVIPNQAIQVDEKNKQFVYCVEKTQNKAVKKYLTTGKLLKDGVQVISGLSVGELVVTAGQHKLVDNFPVKIINHISEVEN